ncbi:MAG: carbohydrate ABC transporter permease [Ruminococcaceae bacterium]|nr:carbohydrate ABC transporter permease [Oscillospiraceae bacterium]
MEYRAFTKKQKFLRVLLYLFMIVLVLFTLLPLVYVVMTAFKPIDEIIKFPPTFFVKRPTADNFADLMNAVGSSAVPFIRYIFNSVFTSVMSVVLTVLFCSMGAYGLVKHKVPFANFFFALILAALMFSTHVTQIPTYLVVNNLKLVDTYWSLIIPKIAVAFNFFLMKQFLEQLPNAFLEAARIDGANELYIFVKIVMPFLAPAWATLIVFSFVSNWNDFFTPLIFITNQALKTLPLALQTINEGGNLARAGATAAATFLMTFPTIIVFSSMQKRVIETMTYSGIK